MFFVVVAQKQIISFEEKKKAMIELCKKQVRLIWTNWNKKKQNAQIIWNNWS